MTYYVTSIRKNDEFIDLKTDNLEEAKKQARKEQSRLTDYERNLGYTTEIRIYKEDIESDDCTCFDYDTIEYNL